MCTQSCNLQTGENPKKELKSSPKIRGSAIARSGRGGGGGSERNESRSPGAAKWGPLESVLTIYDTACLVVTCTTRAGAFL